MQRAQHHPQYGGQGHYTSPAPGNQELMEVVTENESMTQNVNTGNILSSLATDFENLYVNLDELEALLQLFSEHREEEEGYLTMDGAANAAVKMYLTRSRMADALLSAIRDKLRFIRDMAQKSTDTAYDQARATRRDTPEQATAMVELLEIQKSANIF